MTATGTGISFPTGSDANLQEKIHVWYHKPGQSPKAGDIIGPSCKVTATVLMDISYMSDKLPAKHPWLYTWTTVIFICNSSWEQTSFYNDGVPQRLITTSEVSNINITPSKVQKVIFKKT